MASIELIKGSDGSGNASVATVQNTRSPGASTIIVDTVLGINPAGFAGSMGTPHTFTDPITSETITVISEATCVDFTGHIDGSNIEIDDIAPGYVDGGSAVGDIVIIRPTTQYADNIAETLEVSHEDDGTLKNDTVDTDQIVDEAVEEDKIAALAVSNAKLKAGAGEPGGAMNAWTPTGTTITIGDAVLDCQYKKVGRIVHCRFHLTAGSTSALTSPNVPRFTLPVAADAAYSSTMLTYAGVCRYLDASGGVAYAAFFRIYDGDEFEIIWQRSDGAYITELGAPVNLQVNDIFAGEFWYEAAA